MKRVARFLCFLAHSVLSVAIIALDVTCAAIDWLCFADIRNDYGTFSAYCPALDDEKIDSTIDKLWRRYIKDEKIDL